MGLCMSAVPKRLENQDVLVLKLKVVVSHPCSTGTQTQVFWKSIHAFNV